MKQNINQGDLAVMQSVNAAMQEPQDAPAGANGMSGYAVLQKRITKVQLDEAVNTLNKYKAGKSNLERNIIDNQQWYKLRQWEILRRKERNQGKEQIEPTSGWLFNVIANKHATAMDSFPDPDILPREEGDKQTAKMLSSIVPVVLDECNFEQTYSDAIDDKLINGTGIYGVFWDKTKHNGLGDIEINTVDILNLFWEPGITDIEDSRNVFFTSLRDNDTLEEQYPQFKTKLGGKSMNIAEYVYDDTVDTNDKSIIVDWYYKLSQNGKTTLHYVQFILGQEEPIYASEDDPNAAEIGWYDDGEYPFVFDPLYRMKGTPCGFSFIDIGKSAQEFIDRGDQAILQNLLFNSRPRHFVKNNGAINEDEYADATKDLVHVSGSLTDSVSPIQPNPLSEIYVAILTNKKEELKETTGNRDVQTGGTTAGATAASAIAAMQEAGAKLDRDNNKGSYRAFTKVVKKAICRMRQFYDTARCFRIIGENGSQQFVQFSNAQIGPQNQGIDFGIDMGYRMPEFDIKVSAAKESPYSKMAQNELALQFYSAGMFVPQNAPAALCCISMMDFDGKDEILQMIAQNGTLQMQLQQAQQQALQMAAIVDQTQGSQFAAALQAQYGQQGAAQPGNPEPGAAVAKKSQSLGGNAGEESKVTQQARQKTAESSAPR